MAITPNNIVAFASYGVFAETDSDPVTIPVESDVKYGVVYGTNDALTGTFTGLTITADNSGADPISNILTDIYNAVHLAIATKTLTDGDVPVKSAIKSNIILPTSGLPQITMDLSRSPTSEWFNKYVELISFEIKIISWVDGSDKATARLRAAELREKVINLIDSQEILKKQHVTRKSINISRDSEYQEFANCTGAVCTISGKRLKTYS